MAVSASNTNETCKLCSESDTCLLSICSPIVITLFVSLNPSFADNTVILVPIGYSKRLLLSNIISLVSLINNLTEPIAPLLTKFISAVAIGSTTSVDSLTNSNSVVN